MFIIHLEQHTIMHAHPIQIEISDFFYYKIFDLIWFDLWCGHTDPCKLWYTPFFFFLASINWKRGKLHASDSTRISLMFPSMEILTVDPCTHTVLLLFFCSFFLLPFLSLSFFFLSFFLVCLGRKLLGMLKQAISYRMFINSFQLFLPDKYFDTPLHH